MWHSIACGCRIIEKYDTQNPEVKTPLTKEEYLEFMASLQGKDVIDDTGKIVKTGKALPMEDYIQNGEKKLGAISLSDKINLCGEHKNLGYTQELREEIKRVCKIESDKMNAIREAVKQAEDEAKRKEVEELVRKILAEKDN